MSTGSTEKYRNGATWLYNEYDSYTSRKRYKQRLRLRDGTLRHDGPSHMRSPTYHAWTSSGSSRHEPASSDAETQGLATLRHATRGSSNMLSPTYHAWKTCGCVPTRIQPAVTSRSKN